MTHSYVCHDSFVCVQRLTYKCAMTMRRSHVSCPNTRCVCVYVCMCVCVCVCVCVSLSRVLSLTTIRNALKIRMTLMPLPSSHKRSPNTHCNTLQQTATHCNTLQHTATHNTILNFLTILMTLILLPWSPKRSHINTHTHSLSLSLFSLFSLSLSLSRSHHNTERP